MRFSESVRCVHSGCRHEGFPINDYSLGIPRCATSCLMLPPACPRLLEAGGRLWFKTRLLQIAIFLKTSLVWLEEMTVNVPWGDGSVPSWSPHSWQSTLLCTVGCLLQPGLVRKVMLYILPGPPCIFFEKTNSFGNRNPFLRLLYIGKTIN